MKVARNGGEFSLIPNGEYGARCHF